jgi:hypothetical protein
LPGHRPDTLLSGLAIFLGAFLLFQIQPIIAKRVLPWFGGSAAVWTTCMLFFQAALFLGYWYAHGLTRRLSAGWQSGAHLALLATSLAVLPVAPGAAWKPLGGEDPIPRILGLLAASIGLPYLVLSATSPLVQAWYARSGQGVLPYRFFALSNLASLAALFGYPTLIEPLTTSGQQAWTWSAMYVIYVVVCGAVALRAARSPAAPRAARTRAPSWQAMSLWLLLPACGSMLLLAVTNHLCQNVAAIPFLWVVPLGVYLLTFILCFERDGWYPRRVFHPLHAAAIGAASLALVKQSPATSLLLVIPFFAAVLFIFCMYFHGELARRKPAPEHLTHFYLMIALGGALGGMAISLAAPYLLRGCYELPVALGICAFLTLLIEYRKSWKMDIVWTAAAVAAVTVAGTHVRVSEAGVRVAMRSFYGGLRVVDFDAGDPVRARRAMIHGTIWHGSQFLAENRRRQPTAYYARGTGVELALEQFREPGMSVGLIGLGVGTLAAYGRPGETFRFYELNPQVVDLARREFYYLGDSEARTEVVVGDGRLSLERDRDRRFQILVVDAFSSDSIPVHLMSREAFELYFSRLRPGGVLAVHVSNLALDLAPVIERILAPMGKAALRFQSTADREQDRLAAAWILAASDRGALDRPGLSTGRPLERRPGIRAWTDDYSNLFQILRKAGQGK